MDYNTVAADYALHRQVHPGVLEALLTRGRVTAETAVLEVGCGTGNYIGHLQRCAGARASGMDPSAAMLAVARERFPAVALTEGKAELLPYSNASFDLVFSVDVIHHVQGRADYLQEAFRVLKPGGRVCTVTDSEQIIRGRQPLSTYWPETISPELRRYPAISDLRRWMEQAGFQAVEEQQVEFKGRIADIGPYRTKAYSCLHLISREAYERGITYMEQDLRRGPIPWVVRYLLLWGEKAH